MFLYLLGERMFFHPLTFFPLDIFTSSFPNFNIPFYILINLFSLFFISPEEALNQITSCFVNIFSIFKTARLIWTTPKD